ncbi:hypothetical protein [Brevundimonas naejangsanensis]|uniref:hypothetical protein n=1 Tax=Brevundimonas naejangsanensis TaxID=588932 RepID=UPI0026EF0561|nr:hypothetical protein [Brevundimonas naejangsanensis]
MADGLVIRHPQTGAVIFNTTTVNAHSRALITTSGTAGSANVASMLRGTPFIIQALPADDRSYTYVSNFTISGPTISWDASGRNMRLLVGSFAGSPPSGVEAADAGLVVRNPANQAIQVSTKDLSLQLASYGAVTLTYDPNRPASPQPMVHGQVTVSGSNPVLAFRVQDGAAPVSVVGVKQAGGQFTFYFRATSFSRVGLVYWVFDTTSSALLLNTDAALVTLDSVGLKTFDSRAYAMKVVSTHATTGGTNVVAQPAGRSYAAIQSTPCFRATMADLGGYSPNKNPPMQFEVGEPQWPRPLGTRWAYMALSGQQSSVKFNGATIEVGMTFFEQFEGWYPVDQLPSDDLWGTARHTIVDVTGLPSASMPTSETVAVAVTAGVREVTVSSATPVGTVTPAVTASASGGLAPYSYLWMYYDGSTGVGSYGPENTASFQTQTANQDPGTTATARWICRVTDAGGRVGWSQPVTFIHNVNRISITPEPFSFGDATSTTDDPSGFVGVESRKITGITQTIILRVERFTYVGDLSTFTLLVYKGPSATGPWTSVGNLDATGTATRYIDFPISDGEWFYYYAYGDTASGRRTGRFDVQIWNETAGHVGLTIGRLTLTVDANNDYNVADYTPDPINFGNASEVTNDPSGFVGVGSRQITGINRTVTLRVERFNYSGNLSSANTYVYRGPGPNGPWTKVADIDSRGSATRYVDFTVNNGDWVYYYAYGDTSSGRRWGQWDIAFWNESVGHVSLTGGRLALTVDNDDNYNVADYSLNYMDFGNIWFDTYDGGYYTYNNYQSVSGINQPVTVAVQIANYSVSGPIRDSVMACQTQRGDILTTQLYNGTSYMTVYNGDSIRFAVVLNTTGGRRSFGFDVYLYNQNTGDFIDHFNVSGYFGA